MAFEFKFRKKWYVLLADILLVLFSGGYYGVIPRTELSSLIIYVVLNAVFSLVNFQEVGKWYRGLAVYIWSFMTILLLDGIFYMVLLIWEVNQQQLNNIFSDFLTIMMLLIIFLIVKQRDSHAFKKIFPGYYIAFTIVEMANAIVLSLHCLYAKEYNHIRWVFIIISAGVILQMLMVLMLAVSRNLWKEKEALNSYYLSIQEQHYHYLENREKETKSFRHDMRSHLYILDQLLEEGNAKEAKKYLQKMFAVVDAPHHHANIGNPIVDAILTQYLSICEQRKIQFEIKGHMPVTCELPAFDLCTIFSNLLQNAVEAVEACAKKIIFLQFRYDDDNIYIYLENTYTDLQYDNGDLVSTKGDDHGYGINNIKRGVEHCGGMIEYEALEDKFMTFLEFPQTIRAKK